MRYHLLIVGAAETPVFAGQEYLLRHRKRNGPVKARFKYLQESTIRSLPCYTNVSTIEKSLEKLEIDAAFMEKVSVIDPSDFI